MSNAATDYVVGRLINYFGAAEGSSLPPNQLGSLRVPLSSSLVIAPTVPNFGTNAFLLKWREPVLPTDTIDHYIISVYATPSPQISPTLITTVVSPHSPARIEFTKTAPSLILVRIQTVLTSGASSTPAISPTVSYNAI